MIKRPVIYNEWDSNIEDADGNYICGIDNVEGWDDAEAKSVGNEIAAALNDAAKLKLAVEALEAIRDASTWAKSWDHPSHLNDKARVALAKIGEL